MRRTSLLTTLGMLLVAATAFAAPKPAAATWATGKIERIDVAAKTIVIKQGTHDMTFVLAPTAQLLQGKKSLQSSDLAADVGRNVKIRYTTSGATKTADRIEVGDATPAPVPPKKIK